MPAPRNPLPRTGDVFRGNALSAYGSGGAGRGFDPGPALDDLSEILQRREAMERENTRDADRLRLARAEGAFINEAEKRTAALDPMAEDYQKQVREALEGSFADVASGAGFETKEARDAFSVEQRIRIETGVTRATEVRRGLLQKHAETEWKETENRILNAIIADPGSAERILAASAPGAQRLLAAMAPGRRDAFAAALADGVVLAQSEGLAERGQYKEAQAVLRKEGQGIDPDAVRAADRRVKETENRHRAERLRATAMEVEDLEVRIYEGKATEVEVKAARARGLYRDREGVFSQHMRAAQAEQEQRLKVKMARLKVAEERMNGLSSGYPKNQAAADDLFNLTHPDVLTMPPKEVEQAVVAFAASNGMVPSFIRDKVAAAERVQDPALLAYAASMADRIGAKNPVADIGAGDRVVATRALASLMGGDYGQAAKMLIDKGLDKAEVGALTKRFNDDFQMGSDAKRFDFRTAAKDAVGVALPPDAVAEFQNEVRQQYLITGDKAVAVKAAGLRFKEKGWGATGVGGGEAVQRLPPESLLPSNLTRSLTEQQRTSLVEADVRRMIEATGLQLLDKLPDWMPAGTPRYRLAVDPEAENRRKRGEPWQPRLEIMMPEGFWLTPRQRAADGTEDYIRYIPPDEAQLSAMPEFRAIVDKVKSDNKRTPSDNDVSRTLFGEGAGRRPDTRLNPRIPPLGGGPAAEDALPVPEPDQFPDLIEGYTNRPGLGRLSLGGR